MPSLRGRAFSEAERAVLHTNVAKVRGAADWIEAAVDTGNVSLDEGLAALLRANKVPGRRLAEVTCGETVYTALMEARPAGLTMRQLQLATGMSRYYVRKGLLFIRETLALARSTPLTFSLQERWLLGPEAEDCLDFVYLRSRHLLNATRLVMSCTLVPFAALYPEDATVQLIAQQFTALQATLTLIASGPPQPAPLRAGGRR